MINPESDNREPKQSRRFSGPFLTLANATRTTLWTGSMMGGALIFLVLFYSFRNASGHTGVDPTIFIIGYATFFILSIVGLVRSRHSCELRRPSLVSLTVALYGCSLPSYLIHTNRLRRYEDWIVAGMPSQSDSEFDLFLFAALFVIGVCAAFIFSRHGPSASDQFLHTAEYRRES
jgi:hypothetical protein